eukprot:scaffold75592_cov33-Tisochrysis_lutea.AAC.2
MSIRMVGVWVGTAGVVAAVLMDEDSSKLGEIVLEAHGEVDMVKALDKPQGGQEKVTQVVAEWAAAVPKVAETVMCGLGASMVAEAQRKRPRPQGSNRLPN